MANKMLSFNTDRYQKWPAWLIIILACVMTQVVMFVGVTIYSLLSLLVFLIYSLLKDGHTGSVLNMMQSMHFELLGFAGAALALMAWVKWFENRPITSLGFFKQKWAFEIVKGWFWGTVLLSSAFLLSYLFGGLTFDKVDLSSKTIWYVLSLIPLWFIQGGTEELITRGWFLPLINKRSNLAIAVAVSSSLFGLMHLGNDHVTIASMLSLILSGFLMALYMLKTDNIWGVAGLHGAWNFMQGNFFGVAVSGSQTGASILAFKSKVGAPDWLSGGAFGTEGSLMASLVLFVGIAILAWQLKKGEIS